jgi:hypothetical protein
VGLSHSYHLYISTSTVEVYPLSNPMAGLVPYLTHRLERSLAFGFEHLFLFYVHILRSPKILNSQRILKYFHVTPVFRSFSLSVTLHSKPSESRSLRLLKGSPCTRWRIELGCKERWTSTTLKIF